jgi:hypothetical protein
VGGRWGGRGEWAGGPSRRRGREAGTGGGKRAPGAGSGHRGREAGTGGGKRAPGARLGGVGAGRRGAGGTAWLWQRGGKNHQGATATLLASSAGWEAAGWGGLAWPVRLSHGPFGLMKRASRGGPSALRGPSGGPCHRRPRPPPAPAAPRPRPRSGLYGGRGLIPVSFTLKRARSWGRPRPPEARPAASGR